MRAGQLRHRVTLERIRQTDVSDMGVPTEKWEAVGIYWAFVQPVSARQFVANDQLRGEVSHTVRMRYAPGVTLKDRLDYQGRKLNIASVINVLERGHELQLLCVEAAAGEDAD